jgi:hypothetical protein
MLPRRTFGRPARLAFHHSLDVNCFRGNVMAKNLINELAAASPNRRSFMKTIGAATAGVTALSMAGVPPANAATATEVEVLQFALNLEYLEAEFYTYAQYGNGIEKHGVGVNGLANGSNPAEGGKTTGGVQVKWVNEYTGNIGAQIGNDERMHVNLLRDALGADKIAKPEININALGLNISEQTGALQLARIFEDIGVTAYAGAAGLLTTPSVITTAARILATEAEHVASLRTQIYVYGISTPKLDGADILPPPTGTTNHVLSVNTANGLVATRTPGEVLYLAFGMKANVTRGGFFPLGVNGKITESSGPATAANLS